MPPPVQIAYKPLLAPEVGHNNYQPFNPRTETLKAGHVCHPEAKSRPLPCDIVVEHDVGIKVRDGVTLYCDIYRPPSSSDKDGIVPAIVSWSPYGKKYNGITFVPHVPYNIGVPEGCLSGLEKFEGPDPAEFVPRGYAVVNVDSRGVGCSEGDTVIMGAQEGEDGHDVIEALAKMPWCNGKIGLAGNSHLGIVQWHIASQQPPSLKAIAPWEACSDLYREQFVRGGRYESGLWDWISRNIIRGNRGIEDFREMHRRSPTMNSYWADKRVDFSKIQVPAFISVSYSSFVHVMGSIRGFMQIPHQQKWLRVCPWQEWYDLWAVKQSSDELDLFFSRFLKDQDNGFESKIPRVRTCLLRFGEKEPIEDIVEEDFPLPRTEYKSLYFGADGQLVKERPTKAGSVSHDSTAVNTCSSFTWKFDEKTHLVGLPKAIVHVSCPDSNDMDVYICLRKLDAQGKPLLNLNLPWSAVPINNFDEMQDKDKSNLVVAAGFMGVLRASHRAIDESRSMHPQYPFHTHEKEEKIPPGQIVRLEIGIWAMGVEFEAGESISVQVSGSYPLLEERDFGPPRRNDDDNKGMHIIHFGGEYDSQVILPFV